MAGESIARTSTVRDLIGNTPLLLLERVSDGVPTGVRLYAKAEWANPAGSVKDRAALWMLRAAEARGLTHDHVIVDATSGNTGIALAMLGAAAGYRVTLCVPANVAPERRRILRAYGADLVLTPSDQGTDGAQRVAADLVRSDPGRFWYLDQYANEANWRAHYESTGPEIYEQTQGRVTHFIACLGTTGTFVGAGRYLRERIPEVRLVAVQPDGPFHGIEGVKHLDSSKVPAIWDPSLPDEQVSVSTEDAQAAARRLAREEGYLVGTSSGAALVAALRLSKGLHEGNVVMVFPDAGDRYLGERYWEEVGVR